MIKYPNLKEVGKMKSKLMVLGIVGIAAILLSAVTVAQTLHAKRKPEIPFVGMSLVYNAVDYNGDAQIRTISVLRYDEATNCVTVRDSQDQFDLMIVNVENRGIVWSSGTFKTTYVEYWIPTDVKVGSHVGILDYDAVVTGSTVLSVEGDHVRVWELQATYTAGEGTIYGQDTWYYEKRTGLWIAAAWVEWDENGIPISDRNWGGHLVSTNVNLIEGDH